MTEQLVKSKERFEQVVKRMQERLKKQASEGYDKKFLDAQKSSINALVDFYQLCLEAIGHAEELLLSAEIRYSDLHKDTQRLVLYCSLHHINPNEVFAWSMRELEEMAMQRKRFVLPIVDLKEEQEDEELSRKFLAVRYLSREHITVNLLTEIFANA